MRRLQSLLAVLTFALVGCAAEGEPEVAPPTSAAREPVALTSSEIAAYKKEMSQIFTQKNTAARRTARGTVAELPGYGSVALAKVDETGELATTCAGSEQEAVQFLTSTDGLEVK